MGRSQRRREPEGLKQLGSARRRVSQERAICYVLCYACVAPAKIRSLSIYMATKTHKTGMLLLRFGKPYRPSPVSGCCGSRIEKVSVCYFDIDALPCV